MFVLAVAIVSTNPQADGILVLVQDEGDTTREI
jgi:hypothetical protein